MSKPIPQAVRSFARTYYRAVCMRGPDAGKGLSMTYEGDWNTLGDNIKVTTILGETFIVPIAKGWLA